MFVGLNPSTADETQDDPTIRRCIGYAKTWGYGALCMTNLFAFRATDPREMKRHPEPIGPDNNKHLQECAEGAGLVIFAWGKDGAHKKRDIQVESLIASPHCLGLNKDGTPKHPLYLPKAATPEPYSLKEPF